MEELYRGDPSAEYAAYEKIWQRVAPEMEVYPQAGAAENMGRNTLAQLPGAQEDPCCMGSEARNDVRVIDGFIQMEERNERWFAHLACAVRDQRAASVLRGIGAAAGEHLRQLLAVHYLVMGECRPRGKVLVLSTAERYCAALRRAYHEKSCGAFNYLRAADATGDLCLQELFRTFGREETEHARMLLKLLGCRM